MSKKIKLGIIGIGNMGSGHASNIKNGECPDIEITAIADNNSERLAWAKEQEYGENIKYFDNAIDMLDSGVIDSCLIAVPHYDHTVFAIECMKRNIHIMVEKPAGVYTKQVIEMNEEAKKLGATNTHFVTPHGYHDENHYTTAYDLYLIFNECVKYDKFLEVISSSEYETNITQKNGTYRKVLWRQTNLYVNGTRQVPESLTVVGGKTGTTDEAGACLILYSKDSQSHPYISIVMGADTKVVLYDNMTKLISAINISQ